MILFCLAIFLFTGWFLPWWAMPLAAAALGFILPGDFLRTLKIMFAAGLSYAALAYVLDGSSHGLISQRMSGLFGFPSTIFIFGLMFVLGAMSGLTGYRSGIFLKTLCRKPTQS